LLKRQEQSITRFFEVPKAKKQKLEVIDLTSALEISDRIGRHQRE